MNILLTFGHEINTSLQVGDDVYYCPNAPLGGFTTVDNEWDSSTGIAHIGKCIAIDRDDYKIIVEVDSSHSVEVLGVTTWPILDGILSGVFIMFGKSTEANLSSLLGYYAKTTFINDSPEKAELFAVSTEFSESSK